MEHISTFAQQAKSLISNANNIIILAHKNPDGDAIGSGLGMYHHIKTMGKEAIFILPDQLPKNLLWMPGCDKILVHKSPEKEQAEQAITKADLIIMCDFNNLSRLGGAAQLVEQSTAKKILIDHHLEPSVVCDIKYSRPEASSTCEMVYQVVSTMRGTPTIDSTIATCLYTGIVTDTGGFSYSSSNRLTFDVAANLIESGIDKDYILDNLNYHFSEQRLRLLGYCLNNKLTVIPEYHTAYIWLTQKELRKFNYQMGDTEGIVNYPLTIDGIEFSAIFTEKEKITKCSFRSRGSFPASKVAGDHFNGGGHLNAAGGESPLSISETIKKFVSILPQYEQYIEK
ncbi:MAG: bifunctional oligoribonuclease/PAP phosphatase NrnA [Salinivirgaceae bacterium]|nr:bifunctional oligoribonuclease/PAP phosphatase NrnA [Salinivirgaceae bacterium]